MFTILKPSFENKRITSVLGALKHIEERLMLDTRKGFIMRDFHKHEIKPEFFDRFNNGDTVYRADVPYAEFVKQDHVLYKRNVKDKSFELIPEWPEIIGLPGFYLGDGKTDKATRVIDEYGVGARTKLNTTDVELWAAYWAILDILDGAGVGSYNNDNRIPSRDMFLLSYDLETLNYDFLLSSSKTEVEKELQMTRSPQHSLLKWMQRDIEEWISQDPDHLYSVNFNGPYITIDRMSDIRTLAFYAMRENHPILRRLEQLNLI